MNERSEGAEASIDDEIDASDIAALIRRQEQARGCNLFWLTKSVWRRGGRKARPYRIRAFRCACLRIDNGRVDRAVADGIDPDVAAFEFCGPCVDESANAGLGCAVTGVVWDTLKRGDGREKDDRADAAATVPVVELAVVEAPGCAPSKMRGSAF